jgi:hypothetical protein
MLAWEMLRQSLMGEEASKILQTEVHSYRVDNEKIMKAQEEKL